VKLRYDPIPFDAERDRRDELADLSWLAITYKLAPAMSTADDGARAPAKRGQVVPIRSKVCRFCRARLHRAQGIDVSLARHESRCAMATAAERRVWQETRRWPTLTESRRAYMRTRRASIVAHGRCVTCKAPTEINPETGMPLSRCERHRAQQRAYMESYRRVA
jgi:hypothetical protein